MFSIFNESSIGGSIKQQQRDKEMRERKDIWVGAPRDLALEYKVFPGRVKINKRRRGSTYTRAENLSKLKKNQDLWIERTHCVPGWIGEETNKHKQHSCILTINRKFASLLHRK